MCDLYNFSYDHMIFNFFPLPLKILLIFFLILISSNYQHDYLLKSLKPFIFNSSNILKENTNWKSENIKK